MHGYLVAYTEETLYRYRQNERENEFRSERYSHGEEAARSARGSKLGRFIRFLRRKQTKRRLVASMK
ncbi:hypothetical protein [Paenibacillus glycinis]|uniref:Uncharacterized protein n=1 Tax=Paenibacillus glycinis TaxID=2697035 RepID=A0ABW9XWP5_9BACL|nr:hypothetical protein [Paenibacillus glycinis]NBD26853.1 hypothetical protein [Paenibacillus glycinis]